MEKLKGFVEDEDQNLKYLGLLAMSNFMKVHPRVVAEHKSMILGCLNDEDLTIRHRALDLVSGMVTKKNLADITRVLMDHVEKSEGPFRRDLVSKIIEVASANSYAAVTNFEWYIAQLCNLARQPGVSNGAQLRQQLMDVVIRVKACRAYGVSSMVSLLEDAEMFSQVPPPPPPPLRAPPCQSRSVLSSETPEVPPLPFPALTTHTPDLPARRAVRARPILGGGALRRSVAGAPPPPYCCPYPCPYCTLTPSLPPVRWASSPRYSSRTSTLASWPRSSPRASPPSLSTSRRDPPPPHPPAQERPCGAEVCPWCSPARCVGRVHF